MKYLLLIPDGVGIRNFLFSSFIDLLLEKGKVVVWHALPSVSIAPLRERWGCRVKWEPLQEFDDAPAVRFLRQSKMFAQLFWHNDGHLEQLLRNRLASGDWKSWFFKQSAKSLGRLSAGPWRMAWLERCYIQCASRGDWMPQVESYLRAEKPDVVFCTHQRAYRAVPGMLAARKLGIPTATFIYSWDNLPKGEMAVTSDYFFVWSQAMQDELLRYHTNVTASQVFVVGTPQFEPYFNSAMIESRDQICQSLGLDPSRPIVCFSGSAIPTSPYDPIYLGDLAAVFNAMPELVRPQILFRRCPVDFSKRYHEVLCKHPEIAESKPAWVPCKDGDWSQIVPTLEDVRLLTNVVRHCDMVVNLGSTMAMDFAVMDKPGIYIDYDPSSVEGLQQNSIHAVYRQPHFRSVHRFQPVYWVKSQEQLGDTVLHALARPEEKAEARRQWLKELVMEPFSEASARCCQALRRVVALGPA
ncbi:MAG TPA: hypothetical protein VGW77_18765 [Candidatus Binatia bacterium]|jgi:hypothetical protein|nr:hypothetical protein [Candidatus Binatia bacterium]